MLRNVGMVNLNQLMISYLIIFSILEIVKQNYLKDCRLLLVLLPINFSTISIDLTGMINMNNMSVTINIGDILLLHTNFIQ